MRPQHLQESKIILEEADIGSRIVPPARRGIGTTGLRQLGNLRKGPKKHRD